MLFDIWGCSFARVLASPSLSDTLHSVAGGVVFCEGALVRSLARQQQSVSLSSCEAELYALQMVAQESVALAIFAIVFI